MEINNLCNNNADSEEEENCLDFLRGTINNLMEYTCSLE